jgi:hypothetical protein
MPCKALDSSAAVMLPSPSLSRLLNTSLASVAGGGGCRRHCCRDRRTPCSS